MSFQRSILAVGAVVMLGLAQLGLAAGARADEPTYAIPANVNDPGISTARGANLIWLAAEPTRRVGKLLVFLPTGGAANLPTEFKELGTEGARLGYHTIILAYRNELPVTAAPPAGCGPSADPADSPPDCAIDIRMEILDGDGESTVVNVDRANSIENRLNKLLEHLASTKASEGWAKFWDPGGPNPQPVWSEIVIAGASLGAGQAAIIAAQHSVHRAVLLHGWTDASHGWVKRVATPSERYFALIHGRDAFFTRTCDAYLELGLASSCPLPGFTTPPVADGDPNPLLVENRQPPPFGTRQLVFNLAPTLNATPVTDRFHTSTTRDGWIARETDGTPSKVLLSAWRSVLGDSDADTFLDEVDNCPDRRNEDQVDADRDGTGDACDLTPLGTTPPTIGIPGHISVDATGPAGATVPYTVTVTDDIQPAPTPVCTPSTGSLFAIGDTSVACTATDGGANTADASFVVTVRGAKAQLARLIDEVVNSTRLPAAVKTHLVASLAGFDPNKPQQRKAACLALKVFIGVVRFVAPPAQATEWTSDANRIRAVLSC
jgi:HYR domain-containing protein